MRLLPTLPRPARRPPTIPEGKRVYAIGDVHGQRDLLALLISLIRKDTEARPPAETQLVFLGDLIDRGAHSADVLRLLMKASASRKVTVLLGNHEATLLAVHQGDTDAASAWFRHFGGAETLASFGADLSRIDPDDDFAIVAAVRAAVPAEIVAWLGRCPLQHRVGDYFFVHAGVRPGVALKRQGPADMLWIREDFLASEREHGAVIVHGHSIDDAGPTIRANRIGLDTGAYLTGQLTAVGLEGSDVWPIQALAPDLIS